MRGMIKFTITKKVKKLYWVICGKYKCRKSEKPKISYIFNTHYFFLLFAVSARIKLKKYLKK